VKSEERFRKFSNRKWWYLQCWVHKFYT